MPKKPGAPDTRSTYPIESLVVSSFLMMHEEWYWRRPCCVTGCDHRMGPKTDEPGWATNWKPCSGDLPAQAVDKDDYEIYRGLVCPCHVAEILARD